MALFALLLTVSGGLAACSTGNRDPPREGTRVDLPRAPDGVDLDDLSYSRRLRTLLVPARQAGLALIDPDTGRARRIVGFASADSADEGGGLIYVTDRQKHHLTVVDPDRRRIVASVKTRGRPDYVRYVRGRRELWVTIPGTGIQIFRAASKTAPTPAATALIAIPPAAGGPEGIAISARRHRAYVHLQHGQVAAIDLDRRTITDTWQIGCDATHGFPRVDEHRGLLLAGCGSDGEVVLIDIDHAGKQLDHFKAGGGEAILAHSPSTSHFFIRGDPGDAVVTLAASRSGLREIHRTRVASQGHCLTADDHHHAWVCAPNDGSVLRLPDTPTAEDQHRQTPRR